jgi:ABC-type transport system involved in multi-copper enzyme maturation permease subunit
METLNSQWLIARSVLIEAIRRREIYVLVLLSTLLIGAVMLVDFFRLEGITKFYREIALQVMSSVTALAVVVLAARQLPREFENRTIYPLLAKPISRLVFLNGKLLGVMLAAAFCMALFMTIYVLGSVYLGGDIPVILFAQYVYLQLLKMLILASLSFCLSLLLNLDAAITLGVIFFLVSETLGNALVFLYSEADMLAQGLIKFLVFALPQLDLLDLGERAVHATDNRWPPLSFFTLLQLTLYALFYAVVYYGATLLLFRRRAL